MYLLWVIPITSAVLGFALYRLGVRLERKVLEGQRMARDNMAGSWCSGSLKHEDIFDPHIQALTSALELAEANRDPDEIEKAKRELAEIESRHNDEGYYESETAQFDLDTLVSLLNDYAPEGYYWGAHPGDGADFGYWRSDDC